MRVLCEGTAQQSCFSSSLRPVFTGISLFPKLLESLHVDTGALKQPKCPAPHPWVWCGESTAWLAGGTCPLLHPSNCTRLTPVSAHCDTQMLPTQGAASWEVALHWSALQPSLHTSPWLPGHSTVARSSSPDAPFQPGFIQCK